MLRTSRTRRSWTMTAPAPMLSGRVGRVRSAGTSGGSLCDICRIVRRLGPRGPQAPGSWPLREQRDHRGLHEVMHVHDLSVPHLDGLDRAHLAAAQELEAGSPID